MENILEVYTKKNGPILEFVKALRLLYKKYGHIHNDYNRTDTLKKLMKEEYGASFIDNDPPRLVFESAKQKTMFLIRFN